MVKKADLEIERNLYHASTNQATHAESIYQYHAAINFALTSLGYIDSMMQFERKYMKVDNPPLHSVRIIFQYAPILFRIDALQSAESLLSRKLENQSGLKLKEHLKSAKEILIAAHELWKDIENGSIRTDQPKSTGGIVQTTILTVWDRMNLTFFEKSQPHIQRRFVTKFDEQTPGKCTNCGDIVTARKALLFKAIRCFKCNVITSFVILAQKTGTS